MLADLLRALVTCFSGDVENITRHPANTKQRFLELTYFIMFWEMIVELKLKKKAYEHKSGLELIQCNAVLKLFKTNYGKRLVYLYCNKLSKKKT